MERKYTLEKDFQFITYNNVLSTLLGLYTYPHKAQWPIGKSTHPDCFETNRIILKVHVTFRISITVTTTGRTHFCNRMNNRQHCVNDCDNSLRLFPGESYDSDRGIALTLCSMSDFALNASRHSITEYITIYHQTIP